MSEGSGDGRLICVYCGSRPGADDAYGLEARALGAGIARRGMGMVYGGGNCGLMGLVADAVMGAGGDVVGVIPQAMNDGDLAHMGLAELIVVDDMHERARTMKELSDAFVALPGGCGTFDELFQALTWKRLGLHVGPLVIVNVRGYFDPCLELLDRSIRERFMDARHADMWSVVDDPEAVPAAFRCAPEWDEQAIRFAVANGTGSERASS